MRRTAPFLALGALAATSPAYADAPDPDVARLAAAGHSLSWTPPGRGATFGHAETLVHAPLEAVRQLVIDFSNYKALAPSITTSRVVQHWPDGSIDVYLRMGVLNNTLTFWNVTRFLPIRHDPQGAEVLEGEMVPGKGNIDNCVVVWTLNAAGPDSTVLKFDLLLRPSVPAPQSLIDEQLRDSAMDAVNSIHDRAPGGGR
jgi:hypothetical protein